MGHRPNGKIVFGILLHKTEYPKEKILEFIEFLEMDNETYAEKLHRIAKEEYGVDVFQELSQEQKFTILDDYLNDVSYRYGDNRENLVINDNPDESVVPSNKYWVIGFMFNMDDETTHIYSLKDRIEDVERLLEYLDIDGEPELITKEIWG